MIIKTSMASNLQFCYSWQIGIDKLSYCFQCSRYTSWHILYFLLRTFSTNVIVNLMYTKAPLNISYYYYYSTTPILYLFLYSLIYYWKLFLTSQHYFCDSICVSGQEKKRLHWKKENSACNVVFLSKLHCGGNAAYYIRRSNKINECDKYNHPLSHWQQIIIITNTIAITITITTIIIIAIISQTSYAILVFVI